ncbi:MAG: SH3 domain-containing protein [Oscillospiraceae bacterium]|jgi:peptidoglycan hydrolase-like protein with peptidoglycan-binding domain/uncharacterized protein YraI|nr:SH3 domain-containing protein [Oscillospiraceae bacterium]
MKNTRNVRLVSLILALMLCLPAMASADMVYSKGGSSRLFATMDINSEPLSTSHVFYYNSYQPESMELPYVGNGWYRYGDYYVPAADLIVVKMPADGSALPVTPGAPEPDPTPIPTVNPGGNPNAPVPTAAPDDITGQVDPEYNGTILRYTVPAGGLWLYNSIGGSAVVNVSAATALSLTQADTAGWYSTYRNNTIYYVRESDLIFPSNTAEPAQSVRSVVIAAREGDEVKLYTDHDANGVTGSASGNTLSNGQRVNVIYINQYVYGYAIGSTTYYLAKADTTSPSSASVVGGNETGLMSRITIAADQKVRLYYNQSEGSASFRITGPQTLYGTKTDSKWYSVKYDGSVYYMLIEQADGVVEKVEQAADNSGALDGTFSLTIGANGATVYASNAMDRGVPTGTKVASLKAGQTVLAGVYNAEWYTYVYDALEGKIGYIYRGDLSDAAGAGSSSSLKVFLDQSVNLYDKTNASKVKGITLKAAYYVVKSVDDTYYSIVYNGGTYYVKKAEVPKKLSIFLEAGMLTYPAKDAQDSDGALTVTGYYDAIDQGDSWYKVDIAGDGTFAAFVNKNPATPSQYSALKIPAGVTIQLSENTAEGFASQTIINITGPATLYVASLTAEGENEWGSGTNFYKTTYRGKPYLIFKGHLDTVLGEYETAPTDDILDGEAPIATTGTGRSYYVVMGIEGGRLFADTDCTPPAVRTLAPGEVVLATYYTSSLYQVGDYYLPVRYVASVKNGDDAAAVNPENPNDGIADIGKGEIDDTFAGEVLRFIVPEGGLWLYADGQAQGTPVLSLAAGTTVQMTSYAEGVYTLWYGGRQYYVKGSSLTVDQSDAVTGKDYSITLGSDVRLYTSPTTFRDTTDSGRILRADTRVNARVYSNQMNSTSDPHIVYAHTYLDGVTYYFRDPAAVGQSASVDDVNNALIAGNTDTGLVTKLLFDGDVRLYSKPDKNSSSIKLPTTAYVATTIIANSPEDVNFDDGASLATLFGVKYGTEGWYKVAYNGEAWYVKPESTNIVRQIAVSNDTSDSTYTVVVGSLGAVVFEKPDASYVQGSTTDYRYDIDAEKLTPGTTIIASLYSSQWYTFSKAGKTLYFRVTESANTSSNDAVASYRITLTATATEVKVYNTISSSQKAVTGLTLKPGSTYVLRKVNATWSSVMLNGKTYYVKNADLNQQDVDNSTPIGTTSLGKTYTLTVSSAVDVYNNSKLTGTKIGTLAGGTQFTGTKLYVEGVDPALSPDGLVYNITYGSLTGYIAANKVGGVLRGDEADEAQQAGQGGGTQSDGTVQYTLPAETTLYDNKDKDQPIFYTSEPITTTLTKVDDTWYSLRYNGVLCYIPASRLDLEQTGGGSGSGGALGASFNYTAPYEFAYYASADDSISFLGFFPVGTKMVVQKVSDSWYQTSYAGRTVFIKTVDMQLSQIDDQPLPGTDDGPTTDADGKILTATMQVTIGSGTLNLRKEARSGSTIVARIPMNTVLPNYGGVKDATGQYWYQTSFNGKSGYVSGAYVRAAASHDDGSLDLDPTTDIGRSLPVNVDSVNIRTGAGTGYGILGKLTKGALVSPADYEVGSDGMIWYLFSFNGRTGYIRADYLSGSVLSSGLTGNVAIRAGGTNVRTGAGETFRSVGQLARDTVVTIVGSGSDSKSQLWFRITVGGTSGYVRADMVRPLTLAEKNKLLDEVADNYTQLKRGSKGMEVVLLQQQLIRLGFLAAGEADGIYGAKTEAAVRMFQVSAGLTANGIASKTTQAHLFGGTYVPQGDGTKELEWFEGGMELIKQYPYVTVFDTKTGKTWSARYINGSNHADIVPASASDARALVANNITGSYIRRPVIVTINGQDYAGSMYAVGHGTTNYVSYFSGVMCIHFTGSKTHGSDNVDKDHQNAIKDALNYGK